MPMIAKLEFFLPLTEPRRALTSYAERIQSIAGQG